MARFYKGGRYDEAGNPITIMGAPDTARKPLTPDQFAETNKKQVELRSSGAVDPKFGDPSNITGSGGEKPVAGGGSEVAGASGTGGGGAAPVAGLMAAAPEAPSSTPLPTIFNVGTPSQSNPNLGQRSLPMQGLVLAQRRIY